MNKIGNYAICLAATALMAGCAAARISGLTDRAMVLNSSPGATTVSQGEHVSTYAYMCLMDSYNGRGLDSKTATIYIWYSQTFDEFDNLGRAWLKVDKLAVGVRRNRICGTDAFCKAFVLNCLRFIERVNGIEPSSRARWCKNGVKWSSVANSGEQWREALPFKRRGE
jgi:hypothetical protein